MSNRIILFELLITTVLLSYCYADENLVRFGYKGEFWQSVLIEANIEVTAKSINYVYNMYDKDFKKNATKKGILDIHEYQKFLSFIAENSILKLRSASLLDTNTKEEDLETLYKDKWIEHQVSFIYCFFFEFHDRKIEFQVDDLKNITDKRYYLLLDKINKILNVQSYKTIFDFNEYRNKVFKAEKK